VATLPEGAGLNPSLKYVDKPTNTFIIDWQTKQIKGMDDGLSAMRQAAEIIMQNERFAWQIYSSNFGCELKELVGEEYDYVISELPRRIEEAFLVDKRFLSVENFVFSESYRDSIACSFDILTVFGRFRQEVVV
jgi:hypothetical protein